MTDSERKPDFGAGDYSEVRSSKYEGDWIPSDGWNECLYCGETVQAPALYCCEEHEEGRKENGMTKPADSDQIAKARAEKFLDKWKLPPLDPVLLKMAGHTTAFAIHFAVAFAASERQAVIEDCANVAEDPANREPGWSLSTQRMIAAAIRSME